jgi:hypothetical protein
MLLSPNRFPGYRQLTEVNRERLDFLSYPLDIGLPSFNHADTAHNDFFEQYTEEPNGAASQSLSRARRLSPPEPWTSSGVSV